MAKPKMPKKSPEDSEELKAFRLNISQYLKSNKDSIAVQMGGDDAFFIMRPWNDRSVALFADSKSSKLFEALNNVVLPHRFTAIYHKDLKSLEVIWTAYKLDKDDTDIAGRKFSFTHLGKSYNCEFSASSERLLEIAKSSVFLNVSDTGFRNLQSFKHYLAPEDSEEEPDRSIKGTPLSFYIKKIEWSEDAVIDVIQHMNFYLRFYDQICPYIVVHPPLDQSTVRPKSRFVEGSFPSEINSRALNPTLLAFWIAAYDRDIATWFLLHFRILEYVTSYYLQNEQRMAVRKVLSTPHISKDMDKTVDELAGIVREGTHSNDTARFAKMFEEIVDRDRVWTEISLNPDTFTKDLELEGGFKLGAIVSSTKSIDAFGPKGMENVARALRNIRNGLSHGGEAQAGRIILPSSRNLKKLLPWVHLIATAAGEVVLYEHLT